MNIVWIDGGLGNQMFQYALAMKLESLGKQTKIDISKYAEHHAHNDFELDKVFGLSCNYAGEEEIRALGYRKENHLTALLKKSPFRKKTIYTDESLAFRKEVLELDGYYLEGYWQCEKYFSDIQEKVKAAYRFPEFATDRQRETARQIRQSCSVGVHIRRGDYLNYSRYRDICTMRYYRKAMRHFREAFPGSAVFYIFTNDIPWAEENFQAEDVCFVKGNTGVQSFRDMQLMSLCRHNIVANSSFSWWGAWLNPNPDKTVVAPKKWINDLPDEQVDIVPEGWLRVEG